LPGEQCDVFAGVWKEAAGAAQVELLVLDWFKQFLGYPAHAMGLLTSGGSEANLTALVVARENCLTMIDSRAILYASEHRHWSGRSSPPRSSACRPEQIRPLACDADFRLEMNALRDAVADDERAGGHRLPWLVLANAGTTNTGSVDPLGPLADFCIARNLCSMLTAPTVGRWLLTDEGRTLLHGIERADSITARSAQVVCPAVRWRVVCWFRRGELLEQTFMMRTRIHAGRGAES